MHSSSNLLAAVLITITVCTTAWTAQTGPLKVKQPPQNPATFWRDAASGKRHRTSSNPDAKKLAELKGFPGPEGNWEGPLCPSTAEMRALVDSFLATPNPNFPGLGSTVPGMSVSWSSPDCGTFNYAAGLQYVENQKRLTPATLMGLASMTKPIMAAITLMLDEKGAFGPDGLDTPVGHLLTHDQMIALTVGEDPLHPRCPGVTYLFNRDTFNFEPTYYSCPDLSRISLRDLMRANHGMYDFLNEVLLPDGNWQYDESVFFDLYQLLGIDAVAPANSTNGFDYMRSYGLKAVDSAVIGGIRGRDFEISFGNTGFQVLGIILENRSGKSLDELVQTMIVKPLGLDPIKLYVDANKQANLIADNYDIYTGEPLIEQTGLYPIANLNGHTAVNTRSLGLGIPGNINLAGGAGALIANPKSYRAFLDAFVNGGLLGPKAQKELDESYLLIPDYSFPEGTTANGFGLIKSELRGYPGIGDVDVYNHNGALPGILCEDAVLRAPGSKRTWATGVICQNSRINAYPDQGDLFVEFIGRFVAARN